MALLEAQVELMAELQRTEHTTRWTDAGYTTLPKMAVTHFDFEVSGNSQRNDFITFSRLGGEYLNTNDGWSGLSEQIIQINPFSQSRKRVGDMAGVIFEVLDNYRGQPRTGGAFIQNCLADEFFDLFDQESSYHGMEMVFIVNLSPASSG